MAQRVPACCRKSHSCLSVGTRRSPIDRHEIQLRENLPFSFLWRRSGNLFVTGSTHALVDAARNALLVLPFL